jgi:hypothetical protein
LRRAAAAFVLGLGALLLTPGAGGVPDVPGDPTPPVVTPVVYGTLGANGWYTTNVTVNWSVTDPESVILSTSGCDATTLTAETTGTTLTCSATSDGGVTTVSKTFKIDKTPPAVTATPSRGPDANGWYNHALSVSFTGSDGMSGVDTCVAPQAYSGPDSGGASVGGTCTDKAGNVGAASLALRYDATPPQVTGSSAGRGPDSNGWYNHPVSVSFTGSDAMSGVDSCTQPTYSGPDTASASVSGSCVDRAGNWSSQRSFVLQYDATGPTVTATPARAPDLNGWYNHALAVSFGGGDATSGLDSCVAAQTYAGPDDVGASVTGSCRDRAGNTTARSFALKYDATGPQVTATPARGPDANGWYDHTVSVGFSGSDGVSGVSTCSAPQSYSGPDAASASIVGTCSDVAGNVGAGSVALKYDSTPPSVTGAAPARQPDANGWYNHQVVVSFSGADSGSGVDSCTPATYGGPDSGTATVTGTCVDKAGNRSAPTTFALKYDATPPQVTGAAPGRAPDANGWFNHPLTVGFTGSDATSGIDFCSQPTYSGPDGAAASVSGLCTDRAGNTSGAGAFGFKYDATPPNVTAAVPVRPPDRNRWYNRAIAFAFQGQDATSGLDSCSPTTYDGPDGAGVLVTGSCIDQAGNTGIGSFPLDYDATGPTVTATPARNPDANGWYNHPLAVSFAGSDGASGVESCVPPKAYGGPDTASAVLDGYCLDNAGNVGFGTFALKYDATAPTVSGATPARAPDANGWYNHPVAVFFRGSDETSHVDACTSTTYGGPDAPKANVTGTCRDNAGNVSDGFAYGLAYDATPPALTSVGVTPGDRVAVLRWQTSADTARVEVARFAGKSTAGVAVYRGTGDSYTDKGLRNGLRYRYAVTAFDAAGNTATRSVFALPRAPLFSPPAGAKVSAPPLLAWTAVAGAGYYNVQVWRRGKIFSAWPSGTKLRLHASWTYNGRRYRLSPGRYRWYVWPGRGPRSANRYGPLLGSSSFVVVKS